MGQLLKIKCVDLSVNVHILASSSVPCQLTTVHGAKFGTNSQETDVRRTPMDKHFESHKIHWPIHSILSPVATSVRDLTSFTEEGHFNY
jgi:hypothetical protein